MNKVIRVFLNTDLRANHLDISSHALEYKINVNHLKTGEHICFINRAQTMIKVYSKNNIISFLKSPKKQKLDMNIISHIPDSFNVSGGFSYPKLLKKALVNRLKDSIDRSGSKLKLL